MMWAKNSKKWSYRNIICAVYIWTGVKSMPVYTCMNIALYLDKHRQTKHVPFCTLKSCTEKHTECSIGKLNVDMILIFAVGIISFTTPVKLPASRNQGLIKITNHHSLWIQVPPKKILYPPNCILSAFLAATWIHRDWSSWIHVANPLFAGLGVYGWPGRGWGKGFQFPWRLVSASRVWRGQSRALEAEDGEHFGWMSRSGLHIS